MPAAAASGQQRQRMGRDHQLLIGPNDVETNAAVACGD
jgi:hypothetical protein